MVDVKKTKMWKSIFRHDFTDSPRTRLQRVLEFLGHVPKCGDVMLMVEEPRWGNQAEITRKRIRRRSFRSVPALIKAIWGYLREHNHHPRPFIWTATTSKIMRKIRNSLAGFYFSSV